MARLRVCAMRDVPPLGAARFEVGGRTVAIVHLGEEGFRALDAVCTHEHAWLDEGDVDVDACTIECPKHGSVFDLNTGVPRSLPAIVSLQVYPVTVDEDEIWIEV